MSLSIAFHGQADAYRQLCKAVTEDDGATITALIAAGADTSQSNSNGVTPLHVAAETIKPKALKALIEGGADIHQRDIEKHSVLRAALRGKNLECIEMVIQAGADPFNMSYDPKDGREASDKMVSLQHDFDIAMAVEKVSDAFFINQMVSSPHHEDLKGLELRFKDSDVPADTLDRYGKSALIHVCENGYAAAARMLLEHKADPNFRGRDGRTPLHALANGKNPAMVQQLATAGAHLTAKDAKGQTGLDLARSAGNAPMVAAFEQALEAFTRSATFAADNVRAMRTLKFKQVAQS